MAAAAHRAIHQVVDGGRVFSDPLALRILGETRAALEERAEQRPQDRGLRFFIAARSALAEAKLAEAIEQRGVRQLVVLGAGLDTFAYRSPFCDRLAVFEVDHPATQAWKIERMTAAGIEVPSFVHFTPVDLEQTRFLDALAATGFRREERSFFTWLARCEDFTVRLLVERHWGEEAVAARRKAGNPIPERGGHVMFVRTE